MFCDDIIGNNVAIQRKEICACVPLNRCPTIYKSIVSDDSKYFNTILKCKISDHIRCCELNIKGTKEARVVREVFVGTENLHEILEVDTTTEKYEVNTMEMGIVSDSEDSTTMPTEILKVVSTDLSLIVESANGIESRRLEDISLIFPNISTVDFFKNKMNNNSLYLIFPGSERVEEIIDVVPFKSPTSPVPNGEFFQTPNGKSPKRKVLVKKRLLKRRPLKEVLDESESKVSTTLVNPNIEMYVFDEKEKVSQVFKEKKRNRVSFSKSRNVKSPQHDLPSQNLNKIRSEYSKKHYQEAATQEFSSRPSMRKIVYDTKKRSNFLKVSVFILK